eukprot:5944829-Alexandrium_andersonii.AAC.1
MQQQRQQTKQQQRPWQQRNQQQQPGAQRGRQAADEATLALRMLVHMHVWCDACHITSMVRSMLQNESAAILAAD